MHWIRWFWKKKILRLQADFEDFEKIVNGEIIIMSTLSHCETGKLI